MPASAMSNASPSASPQQTLSEPRLPLARYRLLFRALDRVTLPPFQGKLWRSVFGLALRALSDRAAAEGREPESRLYQDIFETKPAAGLKLPLAGDAPRPYVIAADANPEPWTFAPGQALSIELTLIGRAAKAAPSVMEAFARAAAAGLGETRGRAELTSVGQLWPVSLGEGSGAPAGPLAAPFGLEGDFAAVPTAAESPIAPPAPKAVEVHLISPLRITRNNQLVRPDGFRAEHLLRSVVDRVANLALLHTEDRGKPDFALLKRLAGQAEMLRPHLAFQDDARWSARQRTEAPLGGITGDFVLGMSGLEPLWPYLWLGQWVHAGKGAVMGLGALRLRAVGAA